MEKKSEDQKEISVIASDFFCTHGHGRLNQIIEGASINRLECGRCKREYEIRDGEAYEKVYEAEAAPHEVVPVYRRQNATLQ